MRRGWTLGWSIAWVGLVACTGQGATGKAQLAESSERSVNSILPTGTYTFSGVTWHTVTVTQSPDHGQSWDSPVVTDDGLMEEVHAIIVGDEFAPGKIHTILDDGTDMILTVDAAHTRLTGSSSDDDPDDNDAESTEKVDATLVWTYANGDPLKTTSFRYFRSDVDESRHEADVQHEAGIIEQTATSDRFHWGFVRSDDPSTPGYLWSPSAISFRPTGG